MVNREKYFKEIEHLKQSKPIDEDKFMELYQLAIGLNVKKIDKDNLANSILEILFNNGLYSDILIPLKFLDTEIGRVILQVKYGITVQSKIYTTNDVAELAGCSVQNINKDVKREVIKGSQTVKNGPWYFEEKDVIEYLKKKGKYNKETYQEKEENIISSGYNREEEYK